MWPQVLAHSLRKSIEPLSRWSNIIGGISLLGSMILVVADVILRSTIRITFPGTIELVQYLLVIIFFSGMAYTELNKRHIKVDIIVSRFSPPARLVVGASGDLVVLGIIILISWQSVVNAHYSWNSNLTTGMLGIPLWPCGIVIAVFMAIFALAVLIDFLESIDELIGRGGKYYLWLVPGIIVVLALFSLMFWSDTLMPIRIGAQIFGLITLLLMFALIFLQVHIGAAMALVTVLGMGYLSSASAGRSLIGMTSQSTASNYVWSVLPLFMCLGILVAKAKLSRDVYNTAYKWLGHTRGGLASATVGACSAFAAVVGDPMSGAVTMSSVALPEMKTYKYDSKLAAGAIAAGSSIGVLIPPSIGFIVYGIMTEQSIGRLFIAGILPGLILTVGLILSIYFRCLINPNLGPRGPATGFREKVSSITDSWPVIVLFFLVIGGDLRGDLHGNRGRRHWDI